MRPGLHWGDFVREFLTVHSVALSRNRTYLVCGRQSCNCSCDVYLCMQVTKSRKMWSLLLRAGENVRKMSVCSESPS